MIRFLNKGGSGIDTSDATANVDDILAPKTAYVNGKKITGAISTVYSTKDTLVVKSMNIPDDINTIIKFKIHLTTMVYATEDSIVLFDIVSKAFKKYTLSSLSIDSVKDVDISSNATKIAITTDSNVVLFIISGTEIDISSKTVIDYSYFNFFDIDDNYGAGAVSEYNTSKGSGTIIFAFDTNSLTYNIKKLLEGTAHRVGKATNQGRAVITYNTWAGNGWTIHPLRPSFDATSGEIMFGATSDIQCSPNNKYFIGRKDNTFTVKNATNTTIKTFSKTADLFGFTNNDDILYIVHANSLELYDFVNDKLIASYIVPIDVTKTCIVDNGVSFYSLADNKLQYLTKEKVVLGFVKNGMTYYNTSDATATENDILVSKTAYINNKKIIGTIPNNGELNYAPSSQPQTIPEGYTSGGNIPAYPINTNEYKGSLMLANKILTTVSKDVVEIDGKYYILPEECTEYYIVTKWKGKLCLLYGNTPYWGVYHDPPKTIFNYQSNNGYGTSSNRASFTQLVYSLDNFTGFNSPEQSYTDTWVHLGDAAIGTEVKILASSVDIRKSSNSIFYSKDDTSFDEENCLMYSTLKKIDDNKTANLIPDNIKAGVTILGVTGTYTGETTEATENTTN